MRDVPTEIEFVDSYYWLERRSPWESQPHTHEKTIPERCPNDTPRTIWSDVQPLPSPKSRGSVALYIGICRHSVSTMVALFRSRAVAKLQLASYFTRVWKPWVLFLCGVLCALDAALLQLLLPCACILSMSAGAPK